MCCICTVTEKIPLPLTNPKHSPVHVTSPKSFVRHSAGLSVMETTCTERFRLVLPSSGSRLMEEKEKEGALAPPAISLQTALCREGRCVLCTGTRLWGGKVAAGAGLCAVSCFSLQDFVGLPSHSTCTESTVPRLFFFSLLFLSSFIMDK